MGSEFLNHLDCHLSDCESIWIIDSPLVYFSKYLDFLIKVPTGFETDLASVPRIPIIYACFGARAHHEAVLHDYLYRKNSVPIIPRGRADKVFLEAMKTREKSRCVRWPMYAGVRAFGFTSYHKKTVFPD